MLRKGLERERESSVILQLHSKPVRSSSSIKLVFFLSRLLFGNISSRLCHLPHRGNVNTLPHWWNALFVFSTLFVLMSPPDFIHEPQRQHDSLSLSLSVMANLSKLASPFSVCLRCFILNSRFSWMELTPNLRREYLGEAEPAGYLRTV